MRSEDMYPIAGYLQRNICHKSHKWMCLGKDAPVNASSANAPLIEQCLPSRWLKAQNTLSYTVDSGKPTCQTDGCRNIEYGDIELANHKTM